MSGKSYSIKEMKTIVEYLTENKLYGEIKGRKMWMDFANTQVTSRTWQSLKETFLKRILPDIHNPYYSLSIEQINSFRAGYDVSDRNKNKLEIHTISDDSNDNNQNDTQSNNDYGIKEEILAGENIKCSKIPSQNRSSADTVIVDTCYETAEDIQKDLESPGQEPETKSLRDCITYSEPLTPMLQEVLDDFQSEAEIEQDTYTDRDNEVDKRNTEQNSENINKKTTENVIHDDVNQNKSVQDVIEKSQTSSEPTEAVNKDTDPKVVVNDNENPNSGKNNNIQESVPNKTNPECEVDSVQTELAIAEKQAENNKHNATQNKLAEKAVSQNTDSENTGVVVVHDSNSEIIHSSNGLNNSSTSTVDASLPNNPEALKKKPINKKDAEIISAKQNTDVKVTRKRSNSEHTNIANNKKTRLNKAKTKAISETEGKTAVETIREQKKIIANGKSTVEIESKPNKTVDETTPPKKDLNPSDKVEKPSTSNSTDIVMLSDTEHTPNVNGSSEIKNPCLQNVSLYEEQFNKLIYDSYESEDDTNKKKIETVKNNKVNEVTEKQNEVIKKQNEVTEKQKEVPEMQKEVPEKQKEVPEKQNKVIMLRSNSDSETDELPTSSKKKQRPGVISSKTERDRALANVFGFSGAAHAKRRRQLSRRRRTISHNNMSQNTIKTDSSEWTSELDSEGYVSPPRSRKNRQTRKYLKPQSGRILSLEEEGGLFVMYGKKIYPLVKDGKLVKNYLTYLPESESEDERHYWKSKYEEEKNKAEELRRLLQKAKEKSRSSTLSAGQPNSIRNSCCEHNQPQEVSKESGKEICVPANNEKKPEPTPVTSENIKIKFTTKNDQEIHLEGNWPQLHNVLEHVVHIFHKEPQPISTGNNRTVVEPPSSYASGVSTPLVITAVQDPDVHEKVNKIESEIFKEIEERDQEEKTTPVEQENVTKRKAPIPRKSSQSSVSQSPAKRLKTSDMSVKEPEDKTINEKLSEEPKSEGTIETPKKPGRPSKKSLNESQKDEASTIQTRRSKLNTSKTNDNDEVRYKFPPKTTRQTVKSALTDKNSKDKSQKSIAKPPKIFSSPETSCSNSLESTQGYQDSDPSPMKMEFRKKKMINHSQIKYKTLSHLRRSSDKKLYYDRGDSINSSPGNITHRDDSTLKSSIYKSESYQLLMPVAKKSFRQLDPIDEASPVGNDVQFSEQLDSTTRNALFSAGMTTATENTARVDSDLGSSSNVSLPMSPELSVVESLSISRDSIKPMEGCPTLNEIHNNEALVTPMSCNQYLISNIDLAVPLMEQECGIKNSIVMLNNNTDKQPNLVTESLLSKIGTINLTEENNVTDTLDVKLRDLLLESAKKIVIENHMDVDETNVEVPKKTRNKKRCSTPRKRKNSKKSKEVAKVPTLIEEEHTVSLAKGGRQSCPPIIQTLMPDLEEINATGQAIDENIKQKGRKKKDIIKVKILKPKIKKAANDNAKSIQDTTKKSAGTDSGINDTVSGLSFRGDDSVDLIHNHSETCLQAHDCIGDSLEFVENSMNSVLTLEDSSDENLWHSHCEFSDTRNVPDFFSNDAQDVKSFYNPKPDEIACETVYHSPLGTESSLITEDLSDDLPQSQVRSDKWYLLSDEETTNTNVNTINTLDRHSNVTSFGANLKQIFPLTCAVPDLSTISEISRESSNSRRPTEEGTTGDDLNSHNIFD